MKQVYFSHLKGDIIYQIFSLACSAYTAIQCGKKVLVIDSELFDVERLNQSLKKMGLIVVEKNKLQYQKVAVFYGKGNQVLDLTEKMPSVLLAEHNLNLIQGDPVPNKVKELFVCYSLNGIEYTDTYSEERCESIVFDIEHATYRSDFFWLDKVNLTLYDEILKNIRINVPSTVSLNCHVVHLLSMDDIEQCAKQLGKPKQELYEVFTKKYIEIMSMFITKETDTVLIVQKEHNQEMEEYLKCKGNPFQCLSITEPSTFTQVLGSNGIFVGLFDMDKLVGSSCSYYLHQIVPYSQSILIDLDNIYEN
jgi:hypothetical protein